MRFLFPFLISGSIVFGQIVSPIFTPPVQVQPIGGGNLNATNSGTFGQSLLNDGNGHVYWGSSSANSTNAQVAQYSIYTAAPTNSILTNSVSGSLSGNAANASTNSARFVAQTLVKKIDVTQFLSGNTPQPPMLTATNINGHGWTDLGDGINLGLLYCSTNNYGINTLFFPPGIYRVASRTNLLVPKGVSVEGVGFLHGGVQNGYDQNTTNYSMIWFDNLNAVGVVYTSLGSDVSKLSFIEINGYTNPVAHGVEMVKAPLTNFALVGLSCVDTNQGWNGWFRSHMVSVCGFHVGIDNRSAQCDFDYTMFGYNYVGWTTLGVDPTTYLRNVLTNNPSYTNLWALGLSKIPLYVNIWPVADSAQIRHSGGGLRDDGTAYFISKPRNMSINNDSGGACYRYLVQDGGDVRVTDTYFEIYNSYSAYLPTSTNPIATMNNGNLTFENVSIGITPAPQNIWGDQMTNLCWIDDGIASAIVGGSTVRLINTSFGFGTNEGFSGSAPQVSKLIQLYYGFHSRFYNDGQDGWIYRSNPSNRNLDFYELSVKGTEFTGEWGQINDMAQQGPIVMTNFTTWGTTLPYGKVIFQHSNPDYYGGIVRSNSIGGNIVGGFPQQVPFDPNSLYYVRFLQSDKSAPIYYPSKFAYECPEFYTMDRLTTRTNIVLQSASQPIPVPTGNDIYLWNSNKVIYGVSATKTNLISDLR